MSTMRGSALPITYAATSLIATQSRPSHSFQRPRHPARHTSPFAAQRVDVDCRQDGHLAPSTSRSKPATAHTSASSTRIHDHRTACDASDMRTHNQHPHPQRHRHVARSALAHGRQLAPSSKASMLIDPRPLLEGLVQPPAELEEHVGLSSSTSPLPPCHPCRCSTESPFAVHSRPA